jgi:hypothetical protein
MEDMVGKTKAYWIAALRKNCNITRQKLGFFCYFAIFLQSYCTDRWFIVYCQENNYMEML